ncbi:MAG: polymer-forming cytoskeletal protein [Syntrophorhabdaceae bacterium]|nr:polymer-forming cytoskeletal protein [Syntrophorhabdaceae bacterium]
MFRRREKDRIASFIGFGSTFKGNISVKGMLRVDGILEGNIEADSLVVGEKGNIKGDIAVKTANIGGEVHGNIRADEFIEIDAKALIYGDIYTGKISIVEGGVFNGRIIMEKGVSKVVELPSKEN